MPNAHLLVVDDEPNILTTLSTALRLEGYAVDVAGGVRVAEEKLAKRAYDLLLLDVALPDGDGIEMLTRLRAARNEIPVIVMSGHGTIDNAVRATRLGALDFLEKPLSTDRLLLVLENTLRLVRAEAEAKELKAQAGFDGAILGESPAMQQLNERIARAAKAKDANVLVVGERGTGKELVARAIHLQSPRAKGPLEKLNCAAVPGELIESELFGHEAGAFTGATKSRRGKFERANGGTLFLDEVGDMPMPMQAKLLRVLQEREIERVGGGDVIKVDARVVAATNRDLAAAIASGAFRADLYDRLHVVPIEIPPLRARREDIPLLARHFLDLAGRGNDRRGMRITEDALAVLSSYAFPGNVRELRNLIERLVILSPDETIDADQVRSFLPQAGVPTPGGLFRSSVPFRVLVEEAERTILQEALKHYGGQMAATARGLDLERSHLYKKFKALGLRDPAGKAKEDEEDEGAPSVR
ncbi:MAG: sigma-54-dependent Fis family transcriptional regulator [Myxococcales bacterium]|nr:sigma-54-dependent Fis family transcriptional regulator [Myxococcales bacterium]